jgi:hypothetical protein
MSAKYDSLTKPKSDDPSEPANKRARKDRIDIADKVGGIQPGTRLVNIFMAAASS